MKKSHSVLIVLLILVSFIGIDQASKVWAKSSLEGEARKSYIGDTFRIEYAENSGAFLGLGSQLPATPAD